MVKVFEKILVAKQFGVLDYGRTERIDRYLSIYTNI
jgi:hypothetical protein